MIEQINAFWALFTGSNKIVHLIIQILGDILLDFNLLTVIIDDSTFFSDFVFN